MGVKLLPGSVVFGNVVQGMDVHKHIPLSPVRGEVDPKVLGSPNKPSRLTLGQCDVVLNKDQTGKDAILNIT